MCEAKCVLVTGGTGYIASHAVDTLLQAGYRVRVGLRDGADPSLAEQLRAAVPAATAAALSFVPADVTRDAGWAEALNGVWAVVHAAGKMPKLGGDFDEDFFKKVYLEGTKRVLKMAVEHKVSKFIYISSCGALHGVGAPIIDGMVLTEEDWADVKLPKLAVRDRHDALSEMAVWDHWKSLPANTIDLVVLVVAGAAGPPLINRGECTGTLSIVEAFLNRTLPGLINIYCIFADVRTVAKAVEKALVTEAAVGERINISTGEAWVPEIAKELSKEFHPQGYNITVRTIPDFLIKITMRFFSDQLGLQVEVGKKISIANTKMRKILGIEPVPVLQTVLDMAYGMIDLGYYPKTKQYKKFGSRAIKQEEKK